MFNPSAVTPPALRRTYNGTQVNSRRRLPAKVFHTLRRYGERIRVMELQGSLLFSTLEPVIRELSKQAHYCEHLILNFSFVSSIDSVCLRMLDDVRKRLAIEGVRLVFCHTEKIAKAIGTLELDQNTLFPNEDTALESCENSVLAGVMEDYVLSLPSVPPAACVLFARCDAAELALLEARMGSREFSRGETIIHTGSLAEELFIITSGSVEVRLLLEGNRHQRLEVLAAGMSFGELSFLDGSPRSADIIALSEVSCRVIDRSFFEELTERFPGIKAKILNEIAILLSGRLRQANIEISALRN
jgi:CRP-like cAMP-binding protein/anti-anti-sigma regulatory factor